MFVRARVCVSPLGESVYVGTKRERERERKKKKSM